MSSPQGKLELHSVNCLQKYAQ